MEKIRRVMWGREERTATVFVPWDCGFNCPFCTTKAEYGSMYPAKRLEYNFNRQKESVRRLLAYGFIDTVVITGGEPLADISRLKELIGVIRRKGTAWPKVYINTSLNVADDVEDEVLRFLFLACDGLVDGISVSLPYANVRITNPRGYALLGRFTRECPHDWPDTWIRVNSVVKGNESTDILYRFIFDIRTLETSNRPGIWSINLRKDYTTCNQANLNDCFDPIMQTLMSMEEISYKGSEGCLVCRGDTFLPDEDPFYRLIYHRGTENTSLRFGELMVMNDIVIKQDGEIRYDWKQGTALPKRVMDAFCGVENEGEKEWKWKNPVFSSDLTVQRGFGEETCRDRHEMKCGCCRRPIYPRC